MGSKAGGPEIGAAHRGQNVDGPRPVRPNSLRRLCIPSINQSINIRLLHHDKMQVNNSKQKGNTVSKKKSIDVQNVQIKKVKNVKT